LALAVAAAAEQQATSAPQAEPSTQADPARAAAWLAGPDPSDFGVIGPNPVRSYLASGRVRDIAVGDIDMDGDMDMCVARSDGLVNFIMENLGDDLEIVQTLSPLAYNTSVSTAFGDIDNDGDLDVVFGLDGSANAIHINDGGQFSDDPVWLSGPSEATHSVALGDINGDGYLDMIFGNVPGPEYIYLNDGGSFPTQPDDSLGVGEDSGTELALGDLDNDGDLDLVSGGADVILYTYEAGAFSAAQPLGFTASAVALGDITGDGLLDLACSRDDLYPCFHTNQGGSFMGAPSWLSPLAQFPQALSLGDVDGDGDLDLACANRSENILYLNALGTFWEPNWTTETNNNSVTVEFVDLDNDADMDLAFGNNVGTAVKAGITLYENWSPPISVSPSWIGGEKLRTWSVAMGDVDGDGDIDVLCGNRLDKNKLYLNDGTGPETWPSWWTDESNDTRDVALGDVDGDGYLDLICADVEAGANLYMHDGQGLETTSSWTAPAPCRVLAVGFGDMDGDSDLDLVCAGSAWPEECETGYVAVYLNEEGSFGQDPFWTYDGHIQNIANDLVIADLNNDGTTDFVTRTIWQGTQGLWPRVDAFHNQRGSFALAHSERLDPLTSSIALGDIDGDGDPDLACGNFGGGNTLIENRVGIFLGDEIWRGDIPDSTTSVALGDIDGDGDLDLICGNLGQYDGAYLNLGGTFDQVPVWATAPWDSTTDIGLGDLDADGDLDVVCGNAGQSNTSYKGLRTPPYKGDPLAPTNQLPNNPGYVEDVRLEHVSRYVVRVSIDAVDVESDPLYIAAQYKPVGWSEWFDVDISDYGFWPLGPLASSPPGVTHTVDWNIATLPVLPGNEFDFRIVSLSVPSSVGINHGAVTFTGKTTIDLRKPLISMLGTVVDFGVMTEGEWELRSLIISNRGNDTLVVEDVEFSSDDMTLYAPELPIVYPPNMGGVGVQVAFEPISDLTSSGEIRLISNDPVTPVLHVEYVSDIRPLDFEIVSLDLYRDRIVSEGDNVPILVSMHEKVDADYARLFFRRGGESEFQYVATEKQDENPDYLRFLGYLPGDHVGPRGVDFFMRVFHGAVVKDIPLLEAPVHFQVRAGGRVVPWLEGGTLKMISVPLDFGSETSVSEIFTFTEHEDPYRWRMFYWDDVDTSGTRGYHEVSSGKTETIVPGRAFWLIVRDGMTVDVAAKGLTTRADTTFAMDLDPGWNLIGNPFAFGVAWDSLFVDGLRTKVAVDQGVIGAPRTWVEGAGAYNDPVQNPVTVLKPYEGFWIQSFADSTVTMFVPPVEYVRGSLSDVDNDDGSVEGAAEETGDHPGAESVVDYYWLLRIGASCDRLSDRANYLGVAPGAEPGWDTYDVSEPPACPGESISLYFPHGEWEGRSGAYTTDLIGRYNILLRHDLCTHLIPGEKPRGHIWRFDVAKTIAPLEGGEEVTLDFEFVKDLPGDALVYLVDTHLNRVVDLSDANSYRFLLGGREVVPNEDDARFALLVGCNEFFETEKESLPESPEVAALFQNYPNPFTGSTVIRYDVPVGCFAKLSIFDARGALVKVIRRDHPEPGRYELAWDGRDWNGSRAAPGVYFYRLKTSAGFEDTKKMLLVR
jgi:hypothetical protein